MLRAAAILVTAAIMPLPATGIATAQTRAQPVASASFVGTLGRTSRVGRLSIRPTFVVEDSRCPANVQCIQAGTVRLRVAAAGPGVRRAVTVAPGSPAALAGRWLHLVSVCPNRAAGVPMAGRAYRFHFVLSRSRVEAPANRDCS